MWQTLQNLVTFAFLPNDWPTLHRSVPVFGFLFTLLTPLLFLVKAPRRLWALFGASYLGLALWYWTHHQDRYLQIILPWMATCVVAVLVLLWREGIVARLAVCALVFLQVAWGSDVYFIPTHAMLGRSPVVAVVDFLSTGYKKNYKERFITYGEVDTIKKALPKDSRVLVHETHVFLGIGRSAVSDWVGWQGAISYGRYKSAEEMSAHLKKLGVTHLMWPRHQTRRYDSIAGDLKFFYFSEVLSVNPQVYGGWTLSAMPGSISSNFPESVVYDGCGGSYDSGLYALDQMTVPGYGDHAKAQYPKPTRDASPRDAALPARFMLVRESRCSQASSPTAWGRTTLLTRNSDLEMYLCER